MKKLGNNSNSNTSVFVLTLYIIEIKHDIMFVSGRRMLKRTLSNQTRIGAFSTYVMSIFLYNIQLWTLIKKGNRHFPEKPPQKNMNIKWTQVITNDEHDQNKINKVVRYY